MDLKRVLLCIGCNEYETLNRLNGAEEDARNIYEILSRPCNGNYPGNSSRLLLSPTCSEVDKAISELLVAQDNVDTLTIFFAGHGGVAKGSYYLCMKDSKIGKFSTSAYSLSRLFEIINETSPAQCNVIIDACESGGLVSNLGTLLKPELIGMANTSGISIFATSAANEYSLDTPSGGVGTTQLLRVLEGEITVQNTRPYLDLVEVGRAAADLIASEAKKILQSLAGADLASQTPVVWGLNLFGQSRFSKNPVYDNDQQVSLHSMVAIPLKTEAGKTIGDSSEMLWALLYESPENLTPIKIFSTLKPVTEKLANEADVARFISGIAVPLNERMKSSSDLFSSVQLNATLITLLLSWCGNSGLVESQIREAAAQLADKLQACLDDLIREMNDYEHALAFGGLSDFFYLPIRISKILGWSSAALFILDHLGMDFSRLKEANESIMRKILDSYEACILLISDLQSPYVFTLLLATLKYDLHEMGEHYFGLYMAHLFQSKANLARPGLEPESAYDFVKARVNGDLNYESGMVSNPSESLSVMLVMAKLYGLEDAVDPYLLSLDHVSTCVFIPDLHTNYNQEIIHEGQNHNFQIGHGVWTVDDFINRWETACLPQIFRDSTLDITEVVVGALCASLIFPDRTPWFLLRPRSENNQNRER
jgi:hypothetical protein